VSPYAGDRSVEDPELHRCYICDNPYTACTHAGIMARVAATAAPPVDTERILMARASAQTARGTARRAHPGVSQDQVPNVPSTPPQTPGEGAQTVANDGAPDTAPAAAEIEPGDQVLQLSPIARDGGAQMTGTDPITIPAGDPQEYRDVLGDPPEGKTDARTDPQRPRHKGLQGVLVAEEWQWANTGAWTTDPKNSRMVLLTRDVHKVIYVDHQVDPVYRLVARRGTPFPRPRKA
jgi:hypothetical protein